MNAEIRRGSDRFTEREPGRMTRHAFSFGPHYDPARIAFGPMVCHDDHLLGSGRGFETHEHAETEIVTFVVSGALQHQDADGTQVRLDAGEVAVFSAGSGARHSEIAAAPATRFIQVWLRPDTPGKDPSYRHARLSPGDVRAVGSGGPLHVDVAGASLDVIDLDAGESADLPEAGRVHAFLTRGALLRSSLAEPLAAGDSLCLTGEPATTITAAVPSQLLVWSFAD